MGKVGGFSVFLLDFGKGVLSGFVGLWIGQVFLDLHGYDLSSLNLVSYMNPWAISPIIADPSSATYLAQILLAVSFLGCIWGHIFSPWLKFKGGKGVAVAVGCLFVTLGIPAAIFELALFAILVITTRYVSVGSVMAALVCPFVSLYILWGNWACCDTMRGGWFYNGLGSPGENIKRLIKGTESRVGQKSQSGKP